MLLGMVTAPVRRDRSILDGTKEALVRQSKGSGHGAKMTLQDESGRNPIDGIAAGEAAMEVMT